MTLPEQPYVSRPIRRRRRTKAEMNAIRAAIYQALEADQPMTVRQVFYRLTSEGVIEKIEPEYQTVVRLLGEMRRDGSLPYEWLADATRWMRKPTTYSSVEEALRNTAQTYRRDLWNDGSEYVEIWLEKEALAGVLVDVTDPWDVPLMVTRGYSSISYLHSAAKTIYERHKQGKRTTLYYFGDRDPSGVDIDRAIRQGIGESLDALEGAAIPSQSLEEWSIGLAELLDLSDFFNAAVQKSRVGHDKRMENPDYALSFNRTRKTGVYGAEDDDPEEKAIWREATFEDYATFERVAVTERQIADWDLQSRPTKKSDTRSKKFKGESVELDAIPPAELRQLAENIIESHVDQERFKVLQLAEEEERKGLEQIATRLGDDGEYAWAGSIGLVRTGLTPNVAQAARSMISR